MTGVQSIRCSDPVSGDTSTLKYILLYIALSKKNPKALPVIERRRLADYVKAYKEPRFPIVGPRGTEALDHCAVFMEINV